MSEGFNNPVTNAVGTLIRNIIRSQNFVANVSGWGLFRNGGLQLAGQAAQIIILFNDGSALNLYSGNYTEDSGTVLTGAWMTFTPKPQPGAIWAPGAVGAQSNPAGPVASLLIASPYNTSPAGQQSRINLKSGGVIDIDAFIVQVTAGSGNGGGQFFVLASDSGRTVLSSHVVGDLRERVIITGSGSYSIGPGGNNAPDVSIFRDAAGAFGITSQVRIYGNAASDALRLGINGEARLRYMIDTTGGTNIGDGTNPSDVAYYRAAAGKLGITGDVALDTIGRGFMLKEGANAKMGRAVLVAGSVVVNNTKVTAASEIFLTTQIPGGTVGTPYISARTAGTSFTISSTNAADTSTVAWQIVEPS